MVNKEVKKKKDQSLDKEHWKHAKRIWKLPINLGIRNNNQM